MFTVTGGHLGFQCDKGAGVGVCGGKGRVAACKLSGRACWQAKERETRTERFDTHPRVESVHLKPRWPLVTI